MAVQVLVGSKTRVIRGLAVLLLVVGASPALAKQYWVSLGSYSKLSGAESLRDQAAISFDQLSIVPADSPMGQVYRVVAGPVRDRASAEARLQQAQVLGYSGAWLVIKDDGFSMPAAVSADGPGSATITSDSYTSDTYTNDAYTSENQYNDAASGTVLSDYTSDDRYSPAVADGSSEDYNSVPIGQQELVDEAPVNYGLHRLNRDVIAPIGASENSRLKELNTEPDSE